MTVKYEIQKSDHAPCKLVSITKTKFGGDAVNFVCEGTHTYCMGVKNQIETMNNKGH